MVLLLSAHGPAFLLALLEGGKMDGGGSGVELSNERIPNQCGSEIPATG